ncbi:helix-turn-helix domain-containing protein [Streptacidiphilus sp. N1-12]|uniref:Helix-turn-helix domain-containing protein n=2 Tax=Streptacidiphilus alkalitolerans TaxID=3342712 RepID=A0ABV6WNI8_9ACTN
MTSKYKECARCSEAFEGNARGRRRKFCSARCRSAANRLKGKAATGAAVELAAAPRSPHGDKSLLLDVTTSLFLLTVQLQQEAERELHAGTPDAIAFLEKATRLKPELDDVIMLMVQQARDQKMSWSAIADIIGIGANTARDKYSADRAQRMLSRRQERLALPAPRPATGTEPVPRGETGPPTAGTATQLSRALIQLQRAAGVSVKEVAARVGVSPSYVSRILSGSRLPPWQTAERVILACAGDPGRLRPLWTEVRVGPRPLPPHVAAQELHAAVRELYLEAGCPSDAVICAAFPDELRPPEVSGFLLGDTTPPWPVVERVVRALGGSPERSKHLWRSAYPGPARQTSVTLERLTP